MIHRNSQHVLTYLPNVHIWLLCYNQQLVIISPSGCFDALTSSLTKFSQMLYTVPKALSRPYTQQLVHLLGKLGKDVKDSVMVVQVWNQWILRQRK